MVGAGGDLTRAYEGEDCSNDGWGGREARRGGGVGGDYGQDMKAGGIR